MKLTIVLPIHGRPQFVDRFMGLGLPWPVVQLTEPGFLDKIANGLATVTTPYVMLADCDDFPQEKGIAEAIKWLDRYPQFVCASGRIEGVWLFPDKLTGPFRMRSRQYAIYDTPGIYDHDDISDRVLAGFRNSWSYYGVYRTEVLQKIWREVAYFNFTDLMVHEKFCAMRALTLGKVAGLGWVTSLIRQYGTSQGAASRADWMKFYSAKEQDEVTQFMEHLGVDGAALTHAWAAWYAERYKTTYGHPVRKWFGRTFPFLRKLAPLLEIR